MKTSRLERFRFKPLYLLLAALIACATPANALAQEASGTAGTEASSGASLQAEAVTQQQAYERIIAMKQQYPTGTPWDNSDSYYCSSLNILGYGCAGFSFILSDAAFGNNPGTYYYDLSQVRVGDILRIYNDTHSVVVLEVGESSLTIAEGNVSLGSGGVVYWGRTISKNASSIGFVYGVTRYTTPYVEPVLGFYDVGKNDWYVKDGYLEYVVEHNLMSGYSETTFAPNEPVTRAQVVLILYRMAGQPAVSGTSGFSDVASNHYAAKAIAWARQNGIVSGVGSSNAFNPDGSVTREQLAKMTCEYARYCGKDVSTTMKKASSMTGWDKVSWSKEYMGWAVDQGLISGVNGVDLAASSTAIRSQMAKIATVLHRDVLNLG